MASEPWTTRPGGEITRWRNKGCESHPWNVPKWWVKLHNQKTRREVRQLLDEGRYLEAELYGNPPKPYYW